MARDTGSVTDLYDDFDWDDADKHSDDRPTRLEIERDERDTVALDVRGCSCGQADYGAQGHDGGPPLPDTHPHVSDQCCAEDGCGYHVEPHRGCVLR